MPSLSSFVFVPRCVPWDPFKEYLKKIREHFAGHRLLVFEANPGNVQRYSPDIAVIRYHGQKFLAEEMHSQLRDKVDWKNCVALVVPLSNHDGCGFEQLLRFAQGTGLPPAFAMAPDLSLRLLSGGASKNGVLTSSPARAHVSACFRNQDGTVALVGWIADGGVDPADLTVLRGSNSSPIPATVFRYPHPDLFSSCDNPGIAIFTSRKVASDTLRVRDAARNEYKLSLNSGLIDPVLALDEFVKAFNRCRGRRRLSPKEALLIDELFFRVFEGLSSQANNAVSIAEELHYGTPPQAPRVSIVIPFFKAHELIRHQFADFARDDFIKQQDLILVYDAVEDEEDNPDRFKVHMHRVFELYHVPARVLVTNRNCGFSMACNLGASTARAPYLLLLNSDVFPKSKNWLQTLISDFEGDPAVGIVGARLLYPDESLQHAYFSWQHEVLRKNLVMITHPYKGMIPSLVPCKGAVEVDGVTGACMMFRTAEYRSLGMLDTGFIRGDFEDSEICLRFRASGKKIVSDNRVELYHLEGASWAMCSSDLRESLLCINAIRHQKRWGSLIDRIINAEPEEASHDLPKSYC